MSEDYYNLSLCKIDYSIEKFTIKFHTKAMTTNEFDKLPIEAVKKVAPSVVSIVISKFLPKIKGAYGLPGMGMPSSPFSNPFLFGDVEDGHKEKVSIGGGSGFIVHPDGLILTNKHVVFDQDADYTVLMMDGAEYSAKVLSRDPINDIAVLKINAKDLPVVRLGNSGKLEVCLEAMGTDQGRVH